MREAAAADNGSGPKPAPRRIREAIARLMSFFPSEVIMPSSKRSWLCIGAIVALVLVAIPAQASPIVPGQTVSPVDFPGGCACSGFLADTGSLPWSIGPIHGTYRSAVYDRDLGAGVALEFLYQVSVDADSIQDVYRLEMSSFTGWPTDVAYYEAGGMGVFVVPSSAHRSASGSTIDFSLSILPGTRSEILAIRTNASTFTNGSLLIVAGAVDRITVGAFQPSGTPPTPVPEPASLLLLGSGLLAVRRRFARR